MNIFPRCLDITSLAMDAVLCVYDQVLIVVIFIYSCGAEVLLWATVQGVGVFFGGFFLSWFDAEMGWLIGFVTGARSAEVRK